MARVALDGETRRVFVFAMVRYLTFERCSNRAINHRPATKIWSRPISRVLSRAIIHLGPLSPTASSDLPGNARGRGTCSPIWSCSRWGLPCRGVLPPARCALTAPFHPYLIAQRTRGGIFSVALSVGSRPPGVTWHPARRSPDFPPDANIERLPGRLRGGL